MDKNDLIQKITEEYDSLKEYGINEISPYLQDLINRYSNYEITKHAIAITVFGVFFSLSIIGLIWIITQMIRRNNKSTYIDNRGCINEFGSIIMAIWVFIIIISSMGLFVEINNLLAWINIPEIEILKELNVLK